MLEKLEQYMREIPDLLNSKQIMNYFISLTYKSKVSLSLNYNRSVHGACNFRYANLDPN
jgi:hypothetical protein